MSEQEQVNLFDADKVHAIKDTYLTDKNYKFARYICAYCMRRYGEPLKCRTLDLRRCDTCPKFFA